MAKAHIARICECGVEFETTRSTKIFCSDECRRKFSKASFEAVCEGCNKIFRPKRTTNKRFCSRVCGFEHRKRNALSPEHHAEKYAAKPTAKKKTFASKVCDVCGFSFVPKNGSSRLCSQECRSADERNRALLREKSKDTRNREPRNCIECDALFIPIYGDKRRGYCSKECGRRSVRRARRKKERALLRLVSVETVNPTIVFNRDGWRCQLCGTPTPRKLRGLNKPRSPELDHIVPLSRGGSHSYTNTQCACRSCNGDKGNRPQGQMLLFG